MRFKTIFELKSSNITCGTIKIETLWVINNFLVKNLPCSMDSRLCNQCNIKLFKNYNCNFFNIKLSYAFTKLLWSIFMLCCDTNRFITTFVNSIYFATITAYLKLFPNYNFLILYLHKILQQHSYLNLNLQLEL